MDDGKRGAFNLKLITHRLLAANKNEALIELSNVMVDYNLLNDSREFIKEVLMREKQGATLIDPEVALPHGEFEKLSNSAVVIGLSEHGILWEQDAGMVRIVILLAIKKNSQQDPGKTLVKKVIGKIADEKIMKNLKKAATEKDVIRLLS